MGNDGDGDPLTFEVIDQPSKGELSDIDQTTGMVTYTPNDGKTGKDSFAFTVSDNKGGVSDTAKVSIILPSKDKQK